MPDTRIVWPATLTDAHYDFALVLPKNESRETMQRLMREGIETGVRAIADAASAPARKE